MKVENNMVPREGGWQRGATEKVFSLKVIKILFYFLEQF